MNHSSTVAMISLGCPKNLVNSEEMLALLQDAGYAFTDDLAKADAVIINTCAFIESAKTEAIEKILETASYREENPDLKIVVSGCLAQRYADDIRAELPEVDGVMGTGSYSRIVEALYTLADGETPRYFDSINEPVEELERVLTTPRYYAFLRIAEGCDNRCAFCVIPSLRGRYRSRRMEDVLAEAKKLAEAGVKEIIVIAQDITRYGLDLYGERKLAALLRELCRLDFHWVRLHYLYPDEFTPELLDTIAEEPKILKYLDIPIQHCNDRVLKAMRRRGDKAELTALLKALREKIPGVVLRTSLITGLPYEDEAAFDELCDFLREVRIERAGVFPYSPEEGTAAAEMPERVDTAEAERRAELVVDVQSRIMDDFNENRMGDLVEVLCEGFDPQSMQYMGRSYAESPDIDGHIYFTSDADVDPGDFVMVRITGAMDGELVGEREE